MGISAYAVVGMADGSEKRAEDIEAGDRLADPISGGAFTVGKIWQGPGVGMIRVAAQNGDDIDLTEDQNLLVGDGRVAAGQVAPGSPLRTRDGLTVCTGTERLMGDYMVYDIVPEGGAGGASLCANGFAVGV